MRATAPHGTVAVKKCSALQGSTHCGGRNKAQDQTERPPEYLSGRLTQTTLASRRKCLWLLLRFAPISDCPIRMLSS